MLPDHVPSPNGVTADADAQPAAAFGTWSWTQSTDTFLLRDATSGGEHHWQGREWRDRLNHTSRGDLAGEWHACIAARSPWSRECTVTVDGTAHRLLLRGQARAAAPNAPEAIEGVWLDVTHDAAARELAEQRAREQDERLRLAQEAGGVGAFEWHIPEGRVEWSPELERLYDVPPGTLGTSVGAWAEHVHPDDVEPTLARLQASMDRRDVSCEFEFRARLPSGAYRWLSGRVRLTYDEDGAPVKMIGVNADIDARKRSEVALRESQAWFRHLAEALPIMVWAAAPDGTVDYVNDAWRRYAGTVEPGSWLAFVHPDDAAPLQERWRRAVAQGQRHEARARLRRAEDGQYRWHSVRAVPLHDPQGQLIGWFGAFVDDHELRMLVEANQQLLASEQRARQAAEDAGRMKDEFLATLGHELRTPLNAISGWTSLLRRGSLGPQETARAVEVIERNALAQRHLIEELLDVSRIISGHVRLDLEAVFLDDVIAQAIETARPVAEARGLRLEVELGSTQQPVIGDAARLQQVFSNLIGNAVKFTPGNGLVRVQLEHHGDEAIARVIDTGIGIAPDFLPHVFDRFRQAEAPGSRRYGGLGLGLSIVRQVVQMHGGRVAAHSEGEGTGATFVVTLPLGGPPPSEPPSPSARAADNGPSLLRGLSILVIEDDADSREMLSVLLENVGAVPVAAASVTDALRLLGDLQVDVVLSDIGMPERDGFDLIRSLRAFPNPRIRRAPALAVTAFARAEDRGRILGAGFDAHVSKPVEPSELFTTIIDVMRRRSDDGSGSAMAGFHPASDG